MLYLAVGASSSELGSCLLLVLFLQSLLGLLLSLWFWRPLRPLLVTERRTRAGRIKMFFFPLSSGQSFDPREPTPRQWKQQRVLGCHLGGVCMAVANGWLLLSGALPWLRGLLTQSSRKWPAGSGGFELALKFLGGGTYPTRCDSTHVAT